jgi:AcrR family transcriptional regulator
MVAICTQSATSVDGSRWWAYDRAVEDHDATATSRQRLLAAARTLFAQHGFEQTSTAAVARLAGTSESQLIRYFRSKAGLLEAVFNDCWSGLNAELQSRVVAAANVREALTSVLECLIDAFSKDHDTAYLLLFEGRRIRGDSSEINFSSGFRAFETLLGVLITRGKRDGTFATNLNDHALGAALLGLAESMIRERVIAQRTNAPNPFTDEEIRAVFDAVMNGVAG